MNNQQVREIAEAAFKAHFCDIDIVSINVKPGFDHYDDPVVDVKIIYDGEVEQLIAPDKVSEINRGSASLGTPTLITGGTSLVISMGSTKNRCSRVRPRFSGRSTVAHLIISKS